MWSNQHLHDIVNETVVSVTKKLADLELSPCLEENEGERGWAVLRINITGLGDDDFAFFFRAKPRIYYAIAERMKRAPIEDVNDLEIYVKEYFNILCGNIISRINRDQKTSMRFGIPDYYADGVVSEMPPLMKVFYECVDDNVSISLTGVASKPLAV